MSRQIFDTDKVLRSPSGALLMRGALRQLCDIPAKIVDIRRN
ncbi:hypothetical protein [Scytonema sp. UIC 10036]|nr:hypothetical protein [Scytonema sp. UIC 10036]